MFFFLNSFEVSFHKSKVVLSLSEPAFLKYSLLFCCFLLKEHVRKIYDKMQAAVQKAMLLTVSAVNMYSEV